MSTSLVLGLLAAQVSSRPSPAVDVPPAPSQSFELKNPNAFDAARRRTVKAMTEPKQSVRAMALGLDRAEGEPPLQTGSLAESATQAAVNSP